MLGERGVLGVYSDTEGLASISGDEKSELLSTSMSYEVAPATSDQLNKGVESQVPDALGGCDWVGAEEGAGSLTVKLRVGEDQGPSPQELVPWTRQ